MNLSHFDLENQIRRTTSDGVERKCQSIEISTTRHGKATVEIESERTEVQTGMRTSTRTTGRESTARSRTER